MNDLSQGEVFHLLDTPRQIWDIGYKHMVERREIAGIIETLAQMDSIMLLLYSYMWI